tara:strand:- start:157 stop:486 length:330 start_codon:yes stop_codon:yes gene_type:complete
MRLFLLVIIVISFSACSTKYSSLHKDYKKFEEDLNFCLKIACEKHFKSNFYNFYLTTAILAYGGGGGGGGMSNTPKDNISYKAFNQCLQEKGYFKDEDGIFELPFLSCE